MTFFVNANHAEFFRKLFEETACKLAGRAVQIRFRQPFGAEAWGETYQDPFGRVVIDIRPSLPLEKQFNILLHEVAHIKAGHAELVGPTPYASLPSGSCVPTRPATKAEEATMRSLEGEAESLADKLGAWASRHVEERNLGEKDADDLIIAKLVSLQYYKE
jgi:hypothetical protein